MLKRSTIHVDISFIDNGRFLIRAVNDDGEFLAPNEWKSQLFLWHEESFFGTILEKDSEGIVVSSWELVTLLSHEGFSSMIDWGWGERGDAYLAIAPVLLDAIESGKWVPRFDQWRAEGLSFQVPDDVWGEFPEEFWQETLQDQTKKELFRELFQHAVKQSMKSSQHSIWGRIQKLEESTLTSEELSAYFDEEKWSEWTGLKESILPFTLGLRISEPVEDGDSWELETILRDRQKVDRVFSLDDAKLPRNWKTYMPEIQEEQARWMQMMPLLREKDGSLRVWLDDHDAWDFLSVLSEKLISLDVEILLPSWWEAVKDAQMSVKAKLKNTDTSYRPSFVGLNAMLDFDWRLSMNGVELSEDDFRKLVLEKQRLVKIRGQWMKLDPAMIRRIQQMMTKAKEEGISIRDMLEQELVPRDHDEDAVGADEDYDPYQFARIQLELDRSLKKLIHQLRNASEIPLEKVSTTFQGELRPYQHLGMSWMLFLRKYGFGACLADDMGLGKTVQLINYLLRVKETEDVEMPALIIAPTSVLGNWQREIDKFAPSLKVWLHYGSNRLKDEEFKAKLSEVDVVITSYGLSHIDYEELSSVEWSSISLDEAQNIKNSNTKQSRAIRKLTGKHHIALTGTPMENRLSELWSIFDFLNHGYLGGFTQFQKNFIAPIEKNEAEGKIEELQAKIRPFLLRRTKKDPEVELNLPDKLEQKEYCPLTSEQASLYEQLVQDTFEQVRTVTGFERKGLILQMLNRLKQLCNHPALYLKETNPEEILGRSEKMGILKDIVETALDSGEGCIVFTQYISMGEMIQQVIKKEFGVDVPFLNGSTSKQQRDSLVERFQNGEFPIFLLSLKAGGTGLNLTAANHVIHYDRWWNPAIENQATDRAYRIGQKRFVHVHKLITTGTLEEKIDAMLEKKQALNDEIIRSDQWITELSDHDLESLITLG